MEADVHVDDVVADLADGTRVYVQAKLTGTPVAFTETVAQWCGAVASGECRPGDELLLIVTETPGRLRRLAEALQTHRIGASLTSTAAAELARLTDLATAHGLDSTARRHLLDAAKICLLDTQEGRTHEALGAACLNAAVVPAGQGMRAFRALRAAAHTLAAQRAPSDLKTWRGWLTDAGVPLVADVEGSTSARLEARHRALADYRAQWAREQDVLPLADLGLGLTSLTVTGLTDGLRALPEGEKVGPDRLADAMRRQGRLLLLGRPGSGKTVASRLIAARWAATDTAPVPLWLRMRDLVEALSPAGPYRLQASDLVRVAVGTQAPVLEAALVEHVEQGRAVLLLDALDEVSDRRDAVLEAVAGLIGRLPSDLDIMVTSRYSSARAATLLDLPVYELGEPWDLDATLDEVLQTAAGHFGRAPQTEGRRHTARTYHRERFHGMQTTVRRVPLLATLLVLLAAQCTNGEIPTSQAHLLTAVVEASVRRWDIRRSHITVPDTDPRLTADVLLDCYADIAHVITTSPGNWQDAHHAVSRRLQDHWGKPAGAAAVAASHIIEYWDATAGVFITRTRKGTLTARTRLFTELGEARWALRKPLCLEAWMHEALADEERREAARLAAGLSPTAAHLLIRRAVESTDGPLLDLVHEARVEGVVFKEPSLHAYRQAQLDRLATLPDHYPNPASLSIAAPLTTRSPRAELAASLADDNLSTEQTMQLLAHTKNMTSSQTSLIVALCAQRQARQRGDAMTEEELDLLQAALLPAAAAGSTVVKSPSGADLLVRAAVQHLLPLRPHTAPALIATAREGTLHLMEWLKEELPRLGHQEAWDTLSRRENSSIMHFLRSLPALRAPFELLAQLDEGTSELDPRHAWHLDEAAAFIQLLRLPAPHTGLPGQDISDHTALTKRILRTVLNASGLQASLVTAQIRSLRNEDPQTTRWDLLNHPARRTCEPSEPLAPRTVDTNLVLESLASGNEWLSDLTITMALNAEHLEDDLPDQLLTTMPALPTRARYKAAAFLTHRWPAVTLSEKDPITRAGAACIKARALAQAQRHDEAKTLLADPDLLVRNEAADSLRPLPPTVRAALKDALHAPALQWTCLPCDATLPIDVDNCPQRHARPRPWL
ncbi:NACHT domain-containing protein [Streptomyces klenkii]